MYPPPVRTEPAQVQQAPRLKIRSGKYQQDKNIVLTESQNMRHPFRIARPHEAEKESNPILKDQIA